MKYIKVSIFLNIIIFQCFAQYNRPAKVSTAAVVGAMGEAKVNNTTIMWSVGEPIVFTAASTDMFFTQGFHQPMICKASPVIVALNQTSCTLPYTLKVVAGFDKYIWKVGRSTVANAQTNEYNPVSSGKYTVAVMDSTGCYLTSGINDVDMSVKNITPTITPYGTAGKDTLLESSEAFNYQWYVVTPSDGVHRAITGEMNRQYKPLYNGTYYVKINTNEYCVAYSSYYTVNNQGFESVNKYDFEATDSTIAIRKMYEARKLAVYPIPSREKITIDYESPETNIVTMNIYDNKGVVVDSKFVKNVSGKMQLTYQNDNLPTGKYTLSIVDGEHKMNKGIIFE